jgi:glyoxylate reductase
MDSLDRADFLRGLSAGGKYAGIIGVYRHNTSADQIGVFDKEIIRALAPSVKWIAHNGAGYDQIDVHECKAKGTHLPLFPSTRPFSTPSGISVSNTPGAVDDATATTALYLLLSTLRQYSLAERSLRLGSWKPPTTAKTSHDPTGRTLAILGLGGIGLRFAQLAHAFPMRIIYHSRHRVPGVPDWCEYFADVEDMLNQADVLSVHVPLRKDTEGLVSEKWIRSLKKGSIIINTARGKVIDEEAMIRALEDGHVSNHRGDIHLKRSHLAFFFQLASVGLDVYPNEPQVNPRLLEFPHITLLPHMGTETQDSQRKMEVRALTNLKDFLTKGRGSDLIPEMR